MSYDNLLPREAFTMIDEGGATYLDVRTTEEFAAGHARASVNIPIFFLTPEGRTLNEEFVTQVEAQFPKATPLVLGCASGGRSRKACELLAEAGFATLANCDGGFQGKRDPATGEMLIKGWQAEGLPCDE
jgi:arsenate reductase